MLRFFYSIIDVLATVFATLSPIAILHWLAKATTINQLVPPLDKFLDALFAPLNATLSMFLQPIPGIDVMGHYWSLTGEIEFGEQTLPIIQAVLGVTFTFVFVGLNAVSSALKRAEHKMDVESQARMHKKVLAEARQRKEKEATVVVKNRWLMVHVAYDFVTCPSGGQQLIDSNRFDGSAEIDSTAESATFKFNSIKEALDFAVEGARKVAQFYTTLRPMDPQPPFKITLHALEQSEPQSIGFARCRRMVGYAHHNSICFSAQVMELIEAQGLSQTYRSQTMGMYDFEDKRQQDVYQLRF